MSIKERRRGNTTVLSLEGEFISEVNQRKFRELVRNLSERGRNQITVDLGRLNILNSCGLGALVCALTTVRRSGGNLHLARVGSDVMNLLVLTRLDTVVPIDPPVEPALEPAPALSR